MERDLREAGVASGDPAARAARRSRRGAQRRFLVHRQARAGDQLLHRLPHRLSPPGDDWEKIDARGVSQVAALAFEFAARLAARNDRPEFVAPRRR